MKERSEATLSHPLGLVAVILFSCAFGCTFKPVMSPPASSNGLLETTTDAQGWVVIQRRIRDVLLLDQLAILSNSAPIWGKSFEDGEPYIAALSLQTNQILWKVDYLPVAPLVANSRFLFVVERDRLVALALDQGDEKWSISLPPMEFAQMTADEEIALIANKQTIYAIDAEQGRILWRSDAALPLEMAAPLVVDFESWRRFSSLAIHKGWVYARRSDSRECRSSWTAMDAGSGTERWRYAIIQPQIPEGCIPGALPLAFGDGLVFLGVWRPPGCTIQALDEDNAEVVWNSSELNPCFLDTRSVLFFNGKLWVVTGKEIVVLEAKDGSLVERRPYLWGSPLVFIPPTDDIFSWGEIYSRDNAGLMELLSGAVIEKPIPPDFCQGTFEIVGLGNNQIVFVEGNCITTINK